VAEEVSAGLVSAKRALLLAPTDNVVTVLDAVEAGDLVLIASGEPAVRLTAHEHIPFGHKVALRDIAVGEPVYKYGEVIGQASRPITSGQLVHVHNIAGARARGDLGGQR
jgi:altronate dehydratase small subunit